MRRFDVLIQPHKSRLQFDCNKWITNLTDIDIPTNVQNCLALGQKFNLPTKNNEINTNQYIANFESKLQDLGRNDRINIRNNVCNIITNFKKAPTNHSTTDEIMKDNHFATKVFLLENPNVMVLEADKSKVTVIMYKSEYEKKMTDLLQDHSTYVTIDKDPTTSIEKKCSDLVSHWEKQKFIEKNSF